MNTTLRDIDDLRPYHRNPRDHSETSVEEVQNSIRKFGFRVPLVIDDENVIVAGHGRYKAVMKLRGSLDDRITELRAAERDTMAANLAMVNDGRVPVIQESELDSRELSEFRITDNKVTELSEWDEDSLEAQVQRMDDEPIGFTDEELDELLDDYELDLPDEDEDTFELPESGGTGVDLICPNCLEEFEVSVELVQMELDMLTDTEAES